MVSIQLNAAFFKSRNLNITLYGKIVNREFEKDGYIFIEKEWGEEDTFKINFTMKVRLVAADDRVRQDIGKAAVMRGPLVYCMEEADNGKGLRLLTMTDKSLPEAKVYDDEICGISFKAISLPGLRKTGEVNGLYHETDPKNEKKGQC